MMPNSVFITGTKSGIGLELVRQFAVSNNPPKYIFATCRNPNEAKNLRDLADAHKNVILVDLDVSNDQQIEEAVKLVESKVGNDGLNLLINNAGVLISEGCKFPQLNRDVINRHFDVNATSPLMLTQAFFPLLKKAADKNPSAPRSITKAAIVNITSEAGSLHNKLIYSSNLLGSYGYRGSKAGLNVLSKNLSFDLKEHGILIANICPGYVDTGMSAKMTEYLQGMPIPRALIITQKQTPDESVTLVMGTMQRLREAHNGGYFRRHGEKIEDFDFASATAENGH